MSITNSYPAVSDCMPTSEPPLQEKTLQIESLAHITNSAAFYQVAPKLKRALEYMEQPGPPVLAILTDNIQRLQDAFVDALYTFFERNAINLTYKLTLCLNAEMELTVSGEHPEKNTIDELLANSPDLSTAFLELSSQSAALRDLHNLQNMVMSNLASDRPVRLAASRNDPMYLMSIKGEMNHFYFCAVPKGK